MARATPRRRRRAQTRRRPVYHFRKRERLAQQTHAPTPRELSWWAYSDADFAKEAERMKLTGGMRVPSQDRIIGMTGVF